MTKWLLNNVRALRPLRIKFLTIPELAELGEAEELTVREYQAILDLQAYMKQVENAG